MSLTRQAGPVPATIHAATAEARRYAEASRAANTRRTYASQWRRFAAWCTDNDRDALPAAPETVALYLAAAAAAMKTGSLAVALAAIKASHAAAGQPLDDGHPAIRQVWEGIRRSNGVRQDAKAALLLVELRAMTAACGSGLRGVRNRALLLFGFASALRRSELVALDIGDLAFEAEGVRVLIRRSKTDQAGAGQEVCVPYGRAAELCPVTALRGWLGEAGLVGGAVFRQVRGGVVGDRLSDRSIANVIKRAATAAGLDANAYSGHSLRAGLATAAALAGADLATIMRQTRHESPRVAMRYIRIAEAWRNNAARLVL